ncbi:MAG: hypothetical protein WAV78_34030, partial [Xanthobacteraceae bacterium]
MPNRAFGTLQTVTVACLQGWTGSRSRPTPPGFGQIVLCRPDAWGLSASAAAVSGSPAAVARRHFPDRFQRREIRVLCNHSVLSTGFDAPIIGWLRTNL